MAPSSEKRSFHSRDISGVVTDSRERATSWRMTQSEEERRTGGVMVTVKYRYLALATILLSTASFVFCIVYSFLFHFDEVTSSHCNVWNVAPSVSGRVEENGFYSRREC